MKRRLRELCEEYADIFSMSVKADPASVTDWKLIMLSGSGRLID
jgi:hypothetical protein